MHYFIRVLYKTKLILKLGGYKNKKKCMNVYDSLTKLHLLLNFKAPLSMVFNLLTIRPVVKLLNSSLKEETSISGPYVYSHTLLNKY